MDANEAKIKLEKERTRRAMHYSKVASYIAIIAGIFLMALTILVTFVVNVT